jgi:hypothetical protein
MAVMAKAATDPAERARLLADPRAYLADNGMKLPAFVNIEVAEIDAMAPTISFGVTPMLDVDELSEEALQSVSGGSKACCMV